MSKETAISLKSLVIGGGRMGMLIETLLRARGHQVGGVVTSRGDAKGQSLETLLSLESWDVAWEFTTSDAAPALVTQLLRAGVPTVSGTTGWQSERAWELADDCGTSYLHAPNFSLGVAVTRRLVAAASQWLQPLGGYEPAILERHHRHKQDRPSGTAKLLATALGDSAGVPVVSLRQGSVPGEHSVFFEGESESIEITHRAQSREVFAQGAVRAGEWLVRANPRRAVTLEDFLTWSSSK